MGFFVYISLALLIAGSFLTGEFLQTCTFGTDMKPLLWPPSLCACSIWEWGLIKLSPCLPQQVLKLCPAQGDGCATRAIAMGSLPMGWPGPRLR